MKPERAPQESQLRPSILSYLYLVLLAASLLGNVYLAKSRASLERALSITPLMASSPVESKIGTFVDRLSVTNAAGAESTLALEGKKKTVVYIFSPSCHWCAVNYSSILALAKQRSEEYSFVGLSVSSDATSLHTYLAKHPYPFPSYADNSTADLAKLGFIGTPETIVIGENGKIEQHWRGAFGKATGKDVQQFFAVSLPDLSSKFDL